MNFSYAPTITQVLAKDWQSNLLNLAIYVCGMIIYALVIYKFYQMLGKKELIRFEIETPDHGVLKVLAGIWGIVLFFLKSIIVFPVITGIWFLILGSFLLFLSKSNDVSQILLITMTIITSSRIMSYFNEELARELAKLIPIALLGVFIVDPTYFSMDATIAKFSSLPNYIHALLQYMIALFAMEFTLSVGDYFIRKKN